jgi:hypothetical protein
MISYVKGDATQPQGEGNKLVIHIVNDVGRFGSGFALAVLKRYPIVKESYLQPFANDKPLKLGDVQFIKVADDLWFANMVAQHGVIGPGNPMPIQYDALRKCLREVCLFSKRMNPQDNTKFPDEQWSVFGPKFGSGLAGGKWIVVEQIIQDELIKNNIDVTIYEL